MKMEVRVVETGLEELSLKRLCASSVTTKKVIRYLGQENDPLRTILDPPLVPYGSTHLKTELIKKSKYSTHIRKQKYNKHKIAFQPKAQTIRE